MDNYSKWATDGPVVAVVNDGDIFPNFGSDVKGPKFVGHGRVFDDTAVHVDFIAEQCARVRITGQRNFAFDSWRFPHVAVIIVNVDHLRPMEAFATNDVQRIFPYYRAMTGRTIGWIRFVSNGLPYATLAFLTAVRS